MRVRNHVNPFTIRHRLKRVPYNELFDSYSGKLDLEIGFGRGVFLREYSKLFPQRNILGVEVRKQMVQILEQRVTALNLKNIHLVHSTGEICLEDMIEDCSLSRVFLFHPDPWFKKKHAKRRVVSKEFLLLLSQKLLAKGRFYVSSDVESLWLQMLEEINESNQFKQVKDEDFWQNVYQTHWSDFSEKDQRSSFQGVFEKIDSKHV